METGNADLKNNTKSIKELMKRLSLSPSNFYYSKAFNNNANTNYSETDPNLSSMKASESVQFNSSMENTQFLSLLSAATGAGSSQSLTSNLESSSNGSSASLTNINNLGGSNPSGNNINNGSSIGSLINSQMTAFSSNEDNNPFDVTEKRDFIKSQDVEIKQLIINVRI